MDTIRPEETESSERIYDGSLIAVRRDQVRLPNGGTATREIVEHPPVVAMLVTGSDGRLLMVRQYRKPVEQTLLEIPAGGIEPGESELEAVKREMREETGYEPRRVERLLTIYPTPGVSDEVMHLYRAWDLQGDGRPTEASDQLEVEWLETGAAISMARRGEIVDAKSVVAILMLESASKHNEGRGAR